MPIEELSSDVVTQRCAVCQSANQVQLAALSVGVGSTVPNDVDGRVLRMPPCPTCKAEEFLIRSADGEPVPTPGSYPYLHRLLVDQLHAQLTAAGRLDKRLGPLAVPQVPTATVKQFFPDGLKLAPLPPEKLNPIST